MSTISCAYRIYPVWFKGGTQEPMRELADRSALTMGRFVDSIVVIGSGFDQCSGHFVDFRVTYSSTRALTEAS